MGRCRKQLAKEKGTNKRNEQKQEIKQAFVGQSKKGKVKRTFVCCAKKSRFLRKKGVLSQKIITERLLQFKGLDGIMKE
jgi:hypothetical protein